MKGETFEFSASRPFVEYKGKTYVFGCNGCKGIFLKDPEAALKKYKFLEAK
ncbi:MAG: YHS domain-containing protein [Deltaproteobacteria bacterium]|nr:YHS domain-containing protein [Deltaproteobacteria bacterium]